MAPSLPPSPPPGVEQAAAPAVSTAAMAVAATPRMDRAVMPIPLLTHSHVLKINRYCEFLAIKQHVEERGSPA
ncbi:hypothetical protein GCM10010219_33570 [Streptomyces netropsis]|nr:hypothetical protein GCM10010219_33570 [Streptomyces netropsis]